MAEPNMNMIVVCRPHIVAHPKFQPSKDFIYLLLFFFGGELDEDKVVTSCCIPMTMILVPLKLHDGIL